MWQPMPRVVAQGAKNTESPCHHFDQNQLRCGRFQDAAWSEVRTEQLGGWKLHPAAAACGETPTKVIFLTRGADTRFVLRESSTCVFVGERWRTAVLRCAAAYAAQLVEHGWRRQHIDVGER
jgi:hypothetical protein